MVNYTYCNTGFATIEREYNAVSPSGSYLLPSISLGIRETHLEFSSGIYFGDKEPKVPFGAPKGYFLFWGEGFSGVLEALISSRIFLDSFLLGRPNTSTNEFHTPQKLKMLRTW